MIKKRIIFLLLTLWVLVPSFSSAVNVRNDLWDYEDLWWNNNCTINDNYSFDCSESNNVIIGTDSGWLKMSSSYFWTTSWLATYIYRLNGNSQQWYVSSFLFCWENSNPLQSCNSKHNITYEEFLVYKDSNELKSRMWYSDQSTLWKAWPSFIYDNSYILIAPQYNTNWTTSRHWWVNPYNFWLVWYWLQANRSSVVIVRNPFPSVYEVPDNSEVIPIDSVDWYEYISITTWDSVLYFEDQLWYRKDMCFIWTRDLTSLYESWIAYHQWTWYTIFDMYSRLFSVSSMSVKEVWIFINTWFRNYETWFQWLNRSISWTPLYNFVYSWPWNHYIDKSNNLSNPFLWNLSAYYFLWSTRSDFSNYSDLDWEQLAYYCYKKLSYTSSSNDWQNYSISDDHNKVYDQWVAVYVRNNRNYNWQFSWADSINSQSFHWTALDYFTWWEEDFSDFNSFFSKSFNKFASVFSNDITNYDLWLGVLPNFIILFMCAIIFFRFISH